MEKIRDHRILYFALSMLLAISVMIAFMPATAHASAQKYGVGNVRVVLNSSATGAFTVKWDKVKNGRGCTKIKNYTYTLKIKHLKYNSSTKKYVGKTVAYNAKTTASKSFSRNYYFSVSGETVHMATSSHNFSAYKTAYKNKKVKNAEFVWCAVQANVANHSGLPSGASNGETVIYTLRSGK